MNRSPAEVRDRWLNYGRRYARYPTLWDSSLAFASGPLMPEGATLRDYSGRTAGAAWSVGAGDQPKYTQESVRGQAFWAGRYDGVDDTAISSPFTLGTSFSVFSWRYSYSNYDDNVWDGLWNITTTSSETHWIGLHKRNDNADPNFDNAVGITWDQALIGRNHYRYMEKSTTAWPASWESYCMTCNWSSPSAFSFANISIYCGGKIQPIVHNYDHPTDKSLIPSGDVVFRFAKATAATFSQKILLASASVFNRVLTPNEIAILARHPLAAYEVEVPHYWMFPTAGAATTHLWPWQIRRSRRMAGAR